VRVALAGLPGCGKTTAARLVARELGLALVSAGSVFRELAAKRNLSLAEFSRVAEQDPSIDRALDARMLEILRQGDVLVEGRLVAWLVTANGVPALRVWLECPPEVRAARVAAREGVPVEQARAANDLREASEDERYRTIYGVSMDDPRWYDLRVSTHDRTPEQVAAAVVARARAGGSPP